MIIIFYLFILLGAAHKVWLSKGELIYWGPVIWRILNPVKWVVVILGEEPIS